MRLKNISSYAYNKKLRSELTTIKSIWKYNKTFLTNNKIALPHLVLTANEYIKELVLHLENTS